MVDRFVDVALPVPLNQAFTYSIDLEEVQVGARVLVPFAGQRLTGVVIRIHGTPPDGVQVKPVQQVLDPAPVLPDDLMQLATWIAQYYVAPLGEVLRGMLPLSAEVKRVVQFRITDAGRSVLAEGAARGASRRSRLPAEEQDREYAVLNLLENGDAAKLSRLRSAAGAGKALLDGMVRKRWIARETVASERDARRTEQIVVLVDGIRLPKLNANQTALLAELSAGGGRMRQHQDGHRRHDGRNFHNRI